MRYLYKKRFLDAFDALADKEQQLVTIAEKQIREYYNTRNAPYGLRIKKLYQKENSKVSIYEARCNISLRIIWAEQNDLVSFLFVGTHDQLLRFLKNQ